MSSNARAERRRQERERMKRLRCAIPDGYGAVAGWAKTEDDLAEAKQFTHDTVIKLLGDARVGGVQWRIADGDAAYELVDDMARGEKDEALQNHYRRLRAHLREWGGFIVVALAPAVES